MRDLHGSAPGLSVDPGTMVDPLDEDGPRRRIEQGEQPVVAYAELALVGTDQGLKVAPGIACRGLQLPHDPPRHRRVKPAQVARRSLGPADRPGLQRPNLRFNSS